MTHLVYFALTFLLELFINDSLFMAQMYLNFEMMWLLKLHELDSH
jgi:hypothetical protein